MNAHYINLFSALGGNDTEVASKIQKEYQTGSSDGINYAYPEIARTVFRAIRPRVRTILNWQDQEINANLNSTDHYKGSANELV